ncbi:cobyric acid synthase [Sedimentibacter sp. MB31-C6]|uniref:cobyric acid synthase n=1 Tax=Sedimentibacter sp. MB31-C6 TaxID=3109366 RepID=UPI002DDD51DC|nr:cobyric acid synthase [Sedimentibacter sp. MB36-C1]WSI04516.1 cobyric acid synthase [Sedimentibacter sp. MB36-C1]
MAKVIMIQGTTSNAGKSLITAALCRIFKEDGYRVAPFKSQNMALNSYITKDKLEMGRAQVMQAEAAGIEPDVRMNPILLKPMGNKGSQVILNGKVLKDMTAQEYYEYKEELIPHIMEAYNSLSDDYDIIVIEGAGSPAEINLKEYDIVNMGLAKLVDAPVIIVGDIDRGGVFASLAGTMLLFDDDEKSRVKGFVINKFRGDVDILKPGLDMFYDITKVDMLGVVPYLNVDIDDEDSLSQKLTNKYNVSLIDIGVIKLPHISNFTDFNIFSLIKGVSLRYVSNTKELGNPDMIIIPGTKNTINDMKWLRQSGLETRIIKHANEGKAVFGVCGGYQMLGESINDPDNIEGGGNINGIGLLKTKTTFNHSKTTTQVRGNINSISGLFKQLSDIEIWGYEIHMGNTEISEGEPLNNIGLKLEGCVCDNVAGSYIHGIFDNSKIANTIVEILMKQKGLNSDELVNFDLAEYKESQYDILANSVREAINIKKIYKIIGIL